MDELDKVRESLKNLEEMQSHIDKRIKDASVYKESNEQLTKIIKTTIISLVIIVVVFCATYFFSFGKAQSNMYDFLTENGLECTTESEEMNASDNGVILNDVSGSTLNQNNTYGQEVD